jgi:hypothetical protein
MASLIYTSCLDDLARNAIDFDNDSFKVMLVTASYAPNKDTHLRRSDVTNEVSGTGYTAGGAATTATVSKDTANDRVDISFTAVVWSAASITARAAVLYKARGGAASADELVAYVDFGADVTSTAGDFTATFSSPLRFQN